MPTLETFEPRWASPPGDTVLAALRTKSKTVEDLADALRLSDAEARGIVTGATPISPRLAAGLAEQLGASAEFWLRRDALFRESVHWLSVDEIASKLPLKQMSEFGWISSPQSWKDAARACLAFFDIQNAAEWQALYGRRLQRAHYRASSAFTTNTVALAAWVRQAERIADQQTCAKWNRTAFSQLLNEVRYLTREADPQRFLPVLEKRCAATGVKVVVLRAPAGVPISGVARRNPDGSRMILLSARHLTDDHFWFTFYHEAAHMLLHELSEDYVDSLDGPDSDDDIREAEANSYAQELLVPAGLPTLWRDRVRAPQTREVLRLGSALGVAPGIIVGQLQRAGILRYNQLNRLRRRYRWDGSILRT